MVDYSATAFQWAGFTTYNSSVAVTLSDDDPDLDWFGQDTGTPQTINDGFNTYTVLGGGYLETEFIDSETGNAVTENLAFYFVSGVGWVFTPPVGSVFTVGDTITGFGPNGWTDTNGVPYTEIVCFTPGSLIHTRHGKKPIESLKPGDAVLTADNGYQNIRWIGCSAVSRKDLLIRHNLRPIVIRKDAFGPGLPERDLRVSPQHRVLVSGDKVQLNFAEHEMLAPAKGLLNDHSVLVDHSCSKIDYIHMLFDRHEVVFSNGIPTESFHPGHVGLDAVGHAARQELFTLFPQLENCPHEYGQTARAVLKTRESSVLRDQAYSVCV